MARQILKGLTMLMMIVGLALVTAAVANGQANNRVVAQIPFDFVARNMDCRAGKYDVEIINQAQDFLSIRSADNDTQVLSVTHESNTARSEQALNAKLVFHRYGGTYFLSQVWMAGEKTGRELAKSRQERAIERELMKIASARGDNKPLYEVVEISAAR